MKTGYDIILQAGQSNAQGCGAGGMENPFVPNENILYYIDDFERTDLIEKCSDGTGFEVAIAKERGTERFTVNNFSLAFAEEYLKAGLLKEGRKLLIIRAAVGGTGFRDHHWGKTDDLYLRMLEATKNALQLNYGDNDHRMVAFLWHQGEAEVAHETTTQWHYENLKYLIESVREKFACPNLPFLAADFVPEWKNASEEQAALCEVVVKAMRDVCNDLQPAAFVSSDGLLSNRQTTWRALDDNDNVKNDNIHFCRDACAQLGRRYFEKYINLIK